jgi:glycogen operon protein
MTGDDWHDPALTALGMFVSGAPLRSPGPRGEQQVDRSFAMFFNSGDRAVPWELPDNDWVLSGEVVLSTDPKLTIGTPVKTGDRLRLGARSVVVLRET